MKLSKDDPMLTAFVLGELEQGEHAAVEAAIADDPKLAAAVAEIRETTDWLASELSASDEPRLSELERARIEKAAAGPARGRRRIWVAAGAGLVAAAAVVFVLAVPVAQREPEITLDVVTTQERLVDVPQESEITLDFLSSKDRLLDVPEESERGDESRRSRAQKSDRYKRSRDKPRRDKPSPLDGHAVVRGHTGKGDENRWWSGDSVVGHKAGEAKTGVPVPTVPAVTESNVAIDGASDPLAAISTENYSHIVDNPFVAVADDPRSTFSIDVDTASYANVRRFLQNGARPPKDAVRIEEMINYFAYEYAPPRGDAPFAVHFEVASAPWASGHRLVKVGIKGKEIASSQRPRANLVFLIDVSGSMESPGKLPLLKQAFAQMVAKLSARDRVAIVVYAGASGLVLPSTSVNDRPAILSALRRLSAGGSTNGGAGIELAYHVASKNFVKGGTNRVILATDGDFNVGTTGQGDLTRLIEDKARSGVFLTVLGFGMGNYKDGTLEKLADKGNGNYAYIDTLNEAKKVLVEQMSGTLVTIAKDVKIQVEFNPRLVKRHRLIGYENRVLAHRDFNDDKKDAGDIGAGHTVTALYEVEPSGGVPSKAGNIDDLKYQAKSTLTEAANSGELMTVKLRYKKPDGKTSRLLLFSVKDNEKSWRGASRDFKLAAGVAAFGMVLRESEHRGSASFESALALVNAGKGQDRHGYRAELAGLVKAAGGRWIARGPGHARLAGKLPGSYKCDEIECLVDPSKACCARRQPVAAIESELPESLDKNEVIYAMKSVSGRVQECADRYGEFGVIKVKIIVIKVKIIVGPDGSVKSAEALGRFAGTRSGTCVEKAVRRARFAPTKRGLGFTYPFRL